MPPPAAADPTPLTAAEFAGLMTALGPFETRPYLAVAVSGGADSTALALLARDWVAPRSGRLVGLIVDHRLRPEARAEAESTRTALARLSIPAEILSWEHRPLRTKIQAAAREARYALLARACRARDILHLLVAHHREDQAETVAMRAGRGSGERGLAGMPMIRELQGLRLLRPLLAVSRARLVATLRARGVDWLEDPSNRSPDFARVRLRAQALDHRSLVARSVEAGAVRRRADLRAAELCAGCVRPDPLGFVAVARAAWRELGPEDRQLLAMRCLMAVSGNAYPPSVPAAKRLCSLLESPGLGGRAALAGCLVLAREAELLFVREPRAAFARLAPAREGLWDGRFLCRLGALPGPGATIAPLGPAGRCRLDSARRRRWLRDRVPAAVIETLPALWQEGELLAAGLPDESTGMLQARWAPRCPLSAAPWAISGIAWAAG